MNNLLLEEEADGIILVCGKSYGSKRHGHDNLKETTILLEDHCEKWQNFTYRDDYSAVLFLQVPLCFSKSVVNVLKLPIVINIGAIFFVLFAFNKTHIKVC